MQEQEAHWATGEVRRHHDAAALDRTIEREILPRLLLSHRGGQVPAPEQSPQHESDLDRRTLREFVRAIQSTAEEPAQEIVTNLLGEGMSPGAIMLELIGPTADSLGELWYRDDCDFVQVTVATGRLQRYLRELGQRQVVASSEYASSGRILVSSLPGEQHTLGLYMVAEFFYSDGWGVVVGPPAEQRSMVELVASEWFEIVAFSVARSEALLPLRHEIAAARRSSLNPRVRVLIGGHAVNEHRDAVKLLGADARARHPAEAIRVAHRLLAEATANR